MKKYLLSVLVIAFLLMSEKNIAHAQVVSPNIPTPSINQTQNTFSTSSSSQSTMIPTPPPSHPFDYTPLPAVTGPENDIIEVQPLSASRPAAQVDDSITFSVTIQNRAAYSKTLQNVCFESSDGNFGCAWGITLAPGQITTINNVGTWTSGGIKDIWVTWSQDGMNYYQPLNATHVQVNILG